MYDRSSQILILIGYIYSANSRALSDVFRISERMLDGQINFMLCVRSACRSIEEEQHGASPGICQAPLDAFADSIRLSISFVEPDVPQTTEIYLIGLRMWFGLQHDVIRAFITEIHNTPVFSTRAIGGELRDPWYTDIEELYDAIDICESECDLDQLVIPSRVRYLPSMVMIIPFILIVVTACGVLTTIGYGI